jgi:flagellar basal-body rod protein FlgC
MSRISEVSPLEILAKGLQAQRLRVQVISSNLANQETTRTPEGGPYKERQVIQVATEIPGSFSSALDRMTAVEPHIAAVVESQNPPRLVYQPGHPDANADGFVAYPDINPVMAMTDLMSASRLYQANITAVETVRGMQSEASKILTQA